MCRVIVTSAKRWTARPSASAESLFYTSFVRYNENESVFGSAADKASGKTGQHISSGRFGAGSDSGSGGS
jgi:hypothetical protein